MSFRKIKGSNFCRTFKADCKKQIVVCRDCSSKDGCEKFKVYIDPDMIFACLNRPQHNYFSHEKNNYQVCFGI
jgi:hypothetical protein